MARWVDTLRTLADTQALGERLAARLRAGDLLLLEGGLGAGKTTLVRFMSRALGVPESIPITSPTFALMHELAGRLPIVHADLYRLSDPDELRHLGLDELLEESVVFVEWGERFGAELGEPCMRICLFLEGKESRRIEVNSLNARGDELVRGLENTR